MLMKSDCLANVTKRYRIQLDQEKNVSPRAIKWEKPIKKRWMIGGEGFAKSGARKTI